MLDGLLTTSISLSGHRMNEVMKVLTIFATIFMPITFIAGIYGMNFEHMPELGWQYSYFAALGAMLGVAVAMIFFFKKKHWL
jgi:magnesium transporter